MKLRKEAILMKQSTQNEAKGKFHELKDKEGGPLGVVGGTAAVDTCLRGRYLSVSSEN